MGVQVTVKRGFPPFQVDDFGPDVVRSRKGAIYFRPGATVVLTDTEHGFIVKKHPALASRLFVLAKVADSKPVVPKVETTVSSGTFVPPDSPAETDSSREPTEEPSGDEPKDDGDSGKKKKKKRRY